MSGAKRDYDRVASLQNWITNFTLAHVLLEIEAWLQRGNSQF